MPNKIILYIAESQDGYIARENGSVDWLEKYGGGDEDYGYVAFLERIDTLVMGKTTYEQILTFGDYPYAGKKSYVFAQEGKDTEFVRFVSGEVSEVMAGLEDKKEKTIWLVGGAQLIEQFLEADLIDEYIITTMPEKLGSGIALFSEKNKDILLHMKLIKNTDYDNGAVQNTFVRRT